MTTTTVNATPQSASANIASATTSDSLINTDVFMQLLVAQLRYQDPLNPADGTQFVTQLAQFSTLAETTQGTSDLDAIRQALAPLGTSTSATPPASSAGLTQNGSGAASSSRPSGAAKS